MSKWYLKVDRAKIVLSWAIRICWIKNFINLFDEEKNNFLNFVDDLKLEMKLTSIVLEADSNVSIGLSTVKIRASQ